MSWIKKILKRIKKIPYVDRDKYLLHRILDILPSKMKVKEMKEVLNLFPPYMTIDDGFGDKWCY